MSDPLDDFSPGFTVPELPDPAPTAEELLERRAKDFRRKKIAAEARKLIPIQVHIDGPIGIAHFGDPHVDDDGTDIDTLGQHLQIVNRTPGMFAGNVGDYRNNWIGRLARLWADQSTSARDSRVLADWLLKACPWLYLVGGNHDAWSGADDPIAWIAQQVHALHEPLPVALHSNSPAAVLFGSMPVMTSRAIPNGTLLMGSPRPLVSAGGTTFLRVDIHTSLVIRS